MLNDVECLILNAFGHRFGETAHYLLAKLQTPGTSSIGSLQRAARPRCWAEWHHHVLTQTFLNTPRTVFVTAYGSHPRGVQFACTVHVEDVAGGGSATFTWCVASAQIHDWPRFAASSCTQIYIYRHFNFVHDQSAGTHSDMIADLRSR